MCHVMGARYFRLIFCLAGILNSPLCFSQLPAKPCTPKAVNGDFEQPVVLPSCWTDFTSPTVSGWNTTATDNMIEMWDGACMGVPPYLGKQFAELNANMVSNLYEDICTPCPNIVTWQFAHRGRLGTDVCNLKAGPLGGPYTILKTASDGNTAWGFYTGTYNVPPGQTATRFLFESVSAAGGDTTYGNFLDAVDYTFSGLNIITANQSNATCGNNNGSASVTVNTGTPPYTYLWSPGGGTNAVATGLGPGTYTVVVSDAGGCSTTDTVTITSTGSITATASSSTICAGQSTTLSASGGNNYSWSNGATTSSITPAVTTNTTYSVVVSAGGCVDTAFATVTVNPTPKVYLGTDQAICTGQNITLDAGNPGASYLWSTGATTQTISISAAGNYWVIVGINNCLGKDTVATFIAPEAHLLDSSLCTISPIILDPGSGATSYLWSDGSTTETISVDVAGSYWVEVMYGNCKSSDTANVTGQEGGGSLYIPNAFTPNADSINEMFMAKGTGIISFNMSIFDRWGNLIFTSKDISTGWDGKVTGGGPDMNGQSNITAQEDVYVWVIDYTTECKPLAAQKLIGRVSVVK